MFSAQDSFSYPGGLPYDEGQAVPLPPSAPAAPAAPVDNLDRPLDELIQENAPAPRRGNVRGRGMRSDQEVEYVPQPRGERREISPPRQKLYLLSEVDARIHHSMASDRLEKGSDAAEAIDPSSLPHPPADDPLVRANALYIEGPPVTELPTDKVFSYISAYSTSLPLGVEWISDDRLVVVFPSKLSAASALNSLLADPTSPAVLADLSMTTPAATSTAFDATLPTVEGQSVPTHLWPVALRQVATRLRMDADEGGAPDPSDGGVMKERLGIRWAREGDKKAGRKNKSSSFYQRYGFNAGKPKVTPDQFEEDLLSSSFALDRESAPTSGRWGHRDRSASPVGRDSRSLAQRMRRSASPGGRVGASRGLAGRMGDYGPDESDRRRQARLADLDADLDGLSKGERGERERPDRREDARSGRGERREGGGGESRRTEPRPRRDADDLDRELEAFLAQRKD